MNTNDKNTNDRTQQTSGSDQNRRDDDQFWAEWWREYAQTWK
jgi:hypothetical protein